MYTDTRGTTFVVHCLSSIDENFLNFFYFIYLSALSFEIKKKNYLKDNIAINWYTNYGRGGLFPIILGFFKAGFRLPFIGPKPLSYKVEIIFVISILKFLT